MFERVLIDTDLRSYSEDTVFRYGSIYKNDPAMIKYRSGKSVTIDDFDVSEAKLLPFLYLIADEIYEAKAGTIHLSDSPELPFVKHIPTFNDNRPHILDYALQDRGVYFSPIKPIKALVMSKQGITMQNAVLILAAAGLEISLPNMKFDISKAEELLLVREILIEERSNYLISIANIADEAFDRLSKGVYRDTVDWARSEALVKIKPKTIQLGQAMSKLDKNLLRRISYDLFQDGLPAIGSTLIDKGLRKAANKAIEVLLSTLCANLIKNINYRNMPEAVYGFKLNKYKNIELTANNRLHLD